MRKILLSLLLIGGLGSNGWHYDLEEAESLARSQKKYILLNFSGSDWCGPCIMMRRQILDNADFLQMADTSLILVNADFPRNKKNQLSQEQQTRNRAMADKYNAQGKFPFTLLLDANGKTLKTWEGFPDEKAIQFAADIRRIIDIHP